MATVTPGPKYVHGRERPEIAKLIRLDIKAAVAAGELPAASYSVRCHSYSMGGEIVITCAGAPVEVLSEARVLHDFDRLAWPLPNWMSDEAKALETKLESIALAYHDGHERHTNFHLEVSVGGIMPRDEEREAILIRTGRRGPPPLPACELPVGEPPPLPACELPVGEPPNDNALPLTIEEERIACFEAFLKNCEIAS